MSYILLAAKVIIFISIINVWFFRFNRKTPYRGGNASSMEAEFRAYGFSRTMVYLIGTLKVVSALSLVISIWVPTLALPAAALMAVLMTGAIAMHFKVNDALIKSLPAFIFLLLSLLIISHTYFAGNY